MRMTVCAAAVLTLCLGATGWTAEPGRFRVAQGSEPSAPAATPAPTPSAAPAAAPAAPAPAAPAAAAPPAATPSPPPPAAAAAPAAAPAAQAAASAPLVGLAAWNQLIGNSITGQEDGKTLTEHYLADGTAKSMTGNEISRGTWMLVGEVVCFKYADEPKPECYRVEVSGEDATYYDEKGSGTRYKIVKGNPKNL